MKTSAQAAVIGSGPAGLMAAYALARGGIQVSLFEKRKGLGRKLLIAGSSGLNITYDSPAPEFHQHYVGLQGHFERVFREFPPEAWIQFIEKEIGIPTFKGTSRRFFVEGMKASQLLKIWTEKLKGLGVKVFTDHEWSDFQVIRSQSQSQRMPRNQISLSFQDQRVQEFDVVCLALGGGSYEPTEVPLRWVELLKRKNLRFSEFKAANAGYEVDWPPGLLKEAEGKPIKNVVLTSSKGQRSGELVITEYGLEGTPIYFAGVPGRVYLDLKPGLDLDALLARLSSGKENLSPIRRVKKYLNLSEAALALVFHLMPKEILGSLSHMANYLKNFPIYLNRPRPLEEAISSSGGLSWDEVNEDLMLRSFPGMFAAGEMLDWDAPTGGFLIQGSVSEGYFAAQGIFRYLAHQET